MSIAGQLAANLNRRQGTAPHSGFPLPPVPYRMGGEHFRSDDAFVASAVADVDRLIDRVHLGDTTALLDWGCGAGRLAVGIAERLGPIADYHGVDVQERLIKWAERNIARPGYRFTFVDAANARYNAAGRTVRSIPAVSDAVNVLYAYSVLSHMRTDDVRGYLSEFTRVLAPGGYAFFTAFVEDGVPDDVENPDGYGPLAWSGSLHCVRFARGHFERMIVVAGLTVTDFEYGQETDGQSLYIVERPNLPAADVPDA